MPSSSLLQNFTAYLSVERNLSDNTVAAYTHDVSLLMDFLDHEYPHLKPESVNLEVLQLFLRQLHTWDLSAFSQARAVSGIKSYFRFLQLEGIVKTDPTELLQAPKLGKKLPDTLSPGEVTRLLAAIPLGRPEGHRNRAMLETAYSCGLRVSELIGLRLSNLHLDVGYIRVIGKGDKERLVPIGEEAAKQISIYRNQIRPNAPVREEAKDILFLNRLGTGISRIMVFHIIKQAALDAGITKNVHPHTLRHSFATHLVMAGADLRAVQQMLGHRSITTTELYLHLDTQYLEDTLRKFHPRWSE